MFVMLVSYAIGNWFLRENNTLLSSYVSDCDLLKTECFVKQQGIEYKIKFLQSPSALKPFDVELTPVHLSAKNIDIEFSMQDMDMGFNRYSLKKLSGSWQARVVLPVCSLGRNDWKLDVLIDDGSEMYKTRFSFIQQQ